MTIRNKITLLGKNYCQMPLSELHFTTQAILQEKKKLEIF